KIGVGVPVESARRIGTGVRAAEAPQGAGRTRTSCPPTPQRPADAIGRLGRFPSPYNPTTYGAQRGHFLSSSPPAARRRELFGEGPQCPVARRWYQGALPGGRVAGTAMSNHENGHVQKERTVPASLLISECERAPARPAGSSRRRPGGIGSAA